jgi:FkbM family methyltransferase
MKQSIRNIVYEIVIFLLKLNFFKKIINLFVNAYFIDRGYCFDWPYLVGKSSNNLFKGENIFLSKFDSLKIKNCIDVGSNIGEFSKEILKNQNTNVIAFEPLPDCHINLEQIKEISNSKFIYYEYALSNKDGIDNIYFGSKKSPLASLEKKINSIDDVGRENKNTIEVKLQKLNNFIDNDNFKNIDFIKIDTEGHELKVLEGGLDFIKKNEVKLIQIEFNWHHLFTNNTINQFSEILDNYVVTQMNLINGKLIEVDKNHYYSNLFQLSNFIFVKKEFFLQNKNNLLK